MSTLVLDNAGLSKKHVIAATTVGTALEFYDFTIYSFFAIQIGQLFFPGASPVNQFLLSIGVFGVVAIPDLQIRIDREILALGYATGGHCKGVSGWQAIATLIARRVGVLAHACAIRSWPA